jgi:hypothetical protein
MTTAKHITAAQNSPEWHAARLGVITASVAAKLLTAGHAVASNETEKKLCKTLAVERASGMKQPDKNCRNFERGHMFEPIAKAYYSEHLGPITDCGFFIAELGPGLFVGASPDGLVGDDGLVEVKSQDFVIHAECILSNEVPKIYLPQIQTQLLVTCRLWVDFISFCPGLPLFVKRVYPDATLQAVLIESFTEAEKRINQTVATYIQAAANLIPTERIDESGEELTGFDEQT